MDSLLHRSQASHAREALANVRRVCVGWSRVLPTLELSFFLETIHLSTKQGFDKETIERTRQYLFHAQDEGLTPCGCCGLQLSTPLLMSCCGGHICPECMDNKSTTCLLCEDEFDVDEFQRLQPGFFLSWKSNVERSPIGKGSRNSIAALPVPPHHNLPVNVEDQQRIIHHPEEFRRRTNKPGDGHVCDYDFTAGDGTCKLCHEMHDSCNLFNEHSRCLICHAVAQECPEDESKASYLVSKLCRLLLESRDGARHGSDLRPVKAIVYSQFRNALNVVGDRLLKRFGTKCVAEYWGKYRVQELHKFVTLSDCFCMLLSNDGSEGLDLSFVTHIFFLEEVWDSSLRDQAVARAWRMGAKGRVHVETLVAKSSVEETMHSIESSLAGAPTERDLVGSLSCLRGLSTLSEYQQAKTKILLQSLRFITDYHCFASRPTYPTTTRAYTSSLSSAPVTVRDMTASSPLKRKPHGMNMEETAPEKKRSKRVCFKD